MRISPARIYAGVALGLAIFVVGGSLTADFSPEDAALGPFTISRDALFEGRQVAFRNADQMDQAHALVSDAHKTEQQIALWLGASHQYAINGYEAGAENAVFHANRLAQEQGLGLTYLGFGLPNGNAHEFLAAYLHFRHQGLTPDRLVVGALYDDLREPGIRPRVRALLETIEPAALQDLGSAGDHLTQALAEAPSPVDRNAMDGTPQKLLETHVVGWLERAWDPFAQRHRFNAWVGWRWRRGLFDLGELLRQFGSPTRKVPPVPPGMQVWNEAALTTLLQIATADGVAVLVYKVPHPQTEDPFYHDRERYDDFHERLRRLCVSLGARDLDLETLIPLPNFKFESALDHWHFREAGHVLLAQALTSAMAEHD